MGLLALAVFQGTNPSQLKKQLFRHKLGDSRLLQSNLGLTFFGPALQYYLSMTCCTNFLKIPRSTNSSATRYLSITLNRKPCTSRCLKYERQESKLSI